jgi:hypothetical protein
MRSFWVLSVALAFILIADRSHAFQESHGTTVVDLRMDHGNRICTIRINGPHHTTTATSGCNQQWFSWNCLRDDYRYELARISRESGRPMSIRYSEYQCHQFTRNMELLTVW